ncbi:MAG: CDP-alcohol phosphatidyltransferase family protein [Lachnospiraceae bacterium]|nr:CDP-alcohol phosphatidyltransferase family protein [Lachnospiraceae bacterium]
MEETREKDYSHKIFTIPNMLTMLRILLIPLFLWVYLGVKNQYLALGVLAFSFFTDFLDGFIARKYHMVSEFGRALDPVADKLNQASILIALSFRYPIMLIPFGIMFVREIYLGILMLIVIKRSHHVFQAEWYGKVTTFLIYFTMALHLIWPGTVPKTVSWITMGITLFFQLLSFALYAVRNNRLVRRFKNKETDGEEPSQSESSEEHKEA